MRIDLNADLGEGMDDAAILPLLTSANVACAMHAGSPALMDETVRLALQHGVRIGAHPSYDDRANFGRTEMHLDAATLKPLLYYQLGAIAAVAKARNAKLTHVKAHGALYNQAARDAVLARAIAEAVRSFDPELVLVGLAGSVQIEAAKSLGLRTAREAFADRKYAPDGSLVPRSQPGAVFHDPREAAEQAVRLATNGSADTLCLHGDTPGAAAIARSVRDALEKAGVAILPLAG
jgi:UPF0271 protein